ncbi:LysR family transcriptional regulator [Bradyrhizobium sp. U87765 SZCCT0131]|uniref:LysR substrate-binding domain-containing protein n=1 Tax=unclassified Bradyrhizobium TaxID=2631580 RepID=UPI001BA70E55|nr:MULTISPECIES: LysR substrate-binding domain-containing protein [unclassified Bradyrhizobium]MBR1222389.1 LysR family transcriptional regulator [Bradyrhizobium sp. U87765 SZCCT0131]MBR1264127.1 LysR family transcriptional regulator [Bradyrhizobium sp. U87765 SZCCT0134]MBR1308090.1 LysR family transcriptional regulator [Bradyrhizobium sp. U87765 SZCCT0110]MBR1320377.1 LysR family transcriptional regulator [Bradyrhizobium sp. U87765 SZCCT0109]MBR1348510.1 LysR family transcriptional regulator 
MRSIDHFNLRSFDLNLLVAFDALITERSVTKAARRLKLGQPAMSHALSSLRLLLNDEILVRVGTTMQPTTRALALAPRLRELLVQIQGALTPEATFDPLREERIVRLGFSSELEILLMPALTAHLREHAPGIRLLTRLTGRSDVHAMLDNAELDLAVGCFDFGLERHRGIRLFEQTLACCFNPALVRMRLPITEEAYVTRPHALMTLKDDIHGCLSEALARIGRELNVALAASDFLTVLAAAAEAPVLATLPARMARLYAPLFGLTIAAVPLDLRVPAVAMVWSARNDRDPASAWLREAVRTVLAARDLPQARRRERKLTA